MKAVVCNHLKLDDLESEYFGLKLTGFRRTIIINVNDIVFCTKDKKEAQQMASTINDRLEDSKFLEEIIKTDKNIRGLNVDI